MPPRPGDDVDDQLRVLPVLELRRRDVERRAADVAEQHVAVADDELARRDSTSATSRRSSRRTGGTAPGRASRDSFSMSVDRSGRRDDLVVSLPFVNQMQFRSHASGRCGEPARRPERSEEAELLRADS